MKKIISLLAIVVFIACSSDDDNSGYNNGLIGEWMPISGQSYDPENNEYSEMYYYDECGQKGKIIFKSNNTVESYSYEVRQDEECSRSDVYIEDWSIVSDGVLRVSGADSNFYYEINGDELRLEEIDDINDDTNDITYWKKL